MGAAKQIVKGSTAVSAVFASADLLDAIIVSSLTCREAAQVAQVSRDFKAAVERCKHRLRPRLVVACSGSSKVVEADVWSGEVLRCVHAHRSVKKSRISCIQRQPKASRWCTSLSFSPYDHALYLCQYKDEAVLRYNGASLRYTSLSARGCPAPEGIAFACGHMYVASVELSSIMQFSLDGRLLEELILHQLLPWGMVAFRSNIGEALYVCVDEPFDAANYGTPNPAGNHGAVLRVTLSTDGSFCGSRSFCGSPRHWEVRNEKRKMGHNVLNRPSGVSIGNGGQLLYVTSLTDQVLKFGGPNSNEPGKYLGVAIDTAAAGLAHPFDVCWQQETRLDADGNRRPNYLVVTTHTAEQRRKGIDNHSRVSFFTEGGDLLRSLEAPALNEPNMIAME